MGGIYYNAGLSGLLLFPWGGSIPQTRMMCIPHCGYRLGVFEILTLEFWAVPTLLVCELLHPSQFASRWRSKNRQASGTSFFFESAVFVICRRDMYEDT